MTQEISDVTTIESQEAIIHLSEEVAEDLDERVEWEVDNIRIRENGWVDLWEEAEDTYAKSLPPHVVYCIDWGQLDE